MNMRTNSILLLFLFVLGHSISLRVMTREIKPIQCKPKASYNSEEQQAIQKFEQMLENSNAHLMLSVKGEKKMFQVPEDASKVMVLQKLNLPHDQNDLQTMGYAKYFGDKNFSEDSDYHVAPGISEVYCVTENGNTTLMYVGEKFRGNLVMALQDQKFLNSMAKLE